MKPAFSVILLTTLIGAGQGLFVAIYCAEVFGWIGSENTAYFVYGSLLSLGLLGAGLVASFFHLGRPERAWRAATMWRTSWLSREVITLTMVIVTIAVYGLIHHLSSLAVNRSIFTTIVGGVGIVLVLALFLCTGMIYACIKFLQEWATPLTLVNFSLLGLSSGFLLSAAWAAWFGFPATIKLLVISLLLLISAAVFKLASIYRNQRIKPKSTIQTAIGIRHNQISQQATGFMGGSFNTRAFFHGQSALVIRNIVKAILLLVFVVPAVLIVIGLFAPDFRILGVAVVVQFAGLLLERWHFFADSQHPQNLYYQTDRPV
jgi:DMSO reductase anchor subunit